MEHESKAHDVTHSKKKTKNNFAQTDMLVSSKSLLVFCLTLAFVASSNKKRKQDFSAIDNLSTDKHGEKQQKVTKSISFAPKALFKTYYLSKLEKYMKYGAFLEATGKVDKYKMVPGPESTTIPIAHKHYQAYKSTLNRASDDEDEEESNSNNDAGGQKTENSQNLEKTGEEKCKGVNNEVCYHVELQDPKEPLFKVGKFAHLQKLKGQALVEAMQENLDFGEPNEEGRPTTGDKTIPNHYEMENGLLEFSDKDLDKIYNTAPTEQNDTFQNKQVKNHRPDFVFYMPTLFELY